MDCQNCGAEYDDALHVCPHCGAENMEAAVREQENQVLFYRNKAEEVKQKPEKAAKKAGRLVLIAAVALVLLFIIILIGTFAVSKTTAENALKNQQEQLEMLEAFYQAGDYAAMGEYYRGLEHAYGATFEKYKRVDYLYRRMGYLISLLAYDAKSHNFNAEYIADDLDDAFKILAEIHEYETAQFLYDESDGLLYIKRTLTDALINDMMLTEEEINAAVLRYEENTSDYTELAELSAKRLEEKAR